MLHAVTAHGFAKAVLRVLLAFGISKLPVCVSGQKKELFQFLTIERPQQQVKLLLGA